MPTELIINILEQMPDVNTLSAIVHASPVYHAIYLAKREKILTEVTLRKIEELEITSYAGWEEVDPVEVSFLTKPKYVDRKIIELAIRRCHAQYQADGRDNIRLSINECIALRSLTACNFWGENCSCFVDCGDQRDERRALISACEVLFRYGSLETG